MRSQVMMPNMRPERVLTMVASLDCLRQNAVRMRGNRPGQETMLRRKGELVSSALGDGAQAELGRRAERAHPLMSVGWWRVNRGSRTAGQRYKRLTCKPTLADPAVLNRGRKDGNEGAVKLKIPRSSASHPHRIMITPTHANTNVRYLDQL